MSAGTADHVRDGCVTYRKIPKGVDHLEEKGVDYLEEIQARQGHESLRRGRVDCVAAMASANAARPSRTAAMRSGTRPNKLAGIRMLTTKL
ncbi:MAG: hypothetical protein OET79_03820, partial [Nitrospirota bacterium]|nr:hypothetical protein [Nitrospirota bacterium]